MEMIIGGAFQGKSDYAKEKHPEICWKNGGKLEEYQLMKAEGVLDFQEFDEQQHFTQPPAHYTEASLVKTMEELGIGRPSTYAPTITTIIARRYVAKENKNLYMTELGEVVNQMMKEAFPSRGCQLYRYDGRSAG